MGATWRSAELADHVAPLRALPPVPRSSAVCSRGGGLWCAPLHCCARIGDSAETTSDYVLRARHSSTPRWVLSDAPRVGPKLSFQTVLAGMFVQKREGALVESCDILVDGRMRTILEHHELRTLDPTNQRVGEASRRDEIEATERDECWTCDFLELGLGVM